MEVSESWNLCNKGDDVEDLWVMYWVIPLSSSKWYYFPVYNQTLVTLLTLLSIQEKSHDVMMSHDGNAFCLPQDWAKKEGDFHRNLAREKLAFKHVHACTLNIPEPFSIPSCWGCWGTLIK